MGSFRATFNSGDAVNRLDRWQRLEDALETLVEQDLSEDAI